MAIPLVFNGRIYRYPRDMVRRAIECPTTSEEYELTELFAARRASSCRTVLGRRLDYVETPHMGTIDVLFNTFFREAADIVVIKLGNNTICIVGRWPSVEDVLPELKEAHINLGSNGTMVTYTGPKTLVEVVEIVKRTL